MTFGPQSSMQEISTNQRKIVDVHNQLEADYPHYSHGCISAMFLLTSFAGGIYDDIG